MKVLCLGGAGRICREAIADLVKFSDFSTITVADCNQTAGREVVAWLNDPRVDFVAVDTNETERLIALMKRYDIVMDGTPISMNDASAKCIARAGVHGINLNGMSHEWELDAEFKRAGRIMVPGFGMTPGITNLMAMFASREMETVESVRCSHGAFRPIAFSQAIAETTRIEYDPDLPSRVVFEDGRFVQVPCFARPLTIKLPEPFGTHEQYIIPHPEPLTLSKSLAHKGVRLVEARGTWPPANMRLLKAMHEWGMLRNDKVRVNDTEVGVLDVIFAHCLNAPEGKNTALYGYALHVDVVGTSAGEPSRIIMTHTHPASDGSVPDWTALRAYTRCVGIPLSIGTQLIAAGKARGSGTIAPELAFDPVAVFDELQRREIRVHQEKVAG